MLSVPVTDVFLNLRRLMQLRPNFVL